MEAIYGLHFGAKSSLPPARAGEKLPARENLVLFNLWSETANAEIAKECVLHNMRATFVLLIRATRCLLAFGECFGIPRPLQLLRNWTL